MINERNIANSFRAVKGDIIKLQAELLNLRKQQAEILLNLEEVISQLKVQPAKKKSSKKKIFIYDFCREIQPEMMYKLEEAEINHGFNFTMADSIKAALTLKELTEIAKHLNVNFRIRMNDEILDQFNITYSTLLCVIDK